MGTWMNKLALTTSLAVLAALFGGGCADDPYANQHEGPGPSSGAPGQGTGVPDSGSPPHPPGHLLSGAISTGYDGGVGDGFLVVLSGSTVASTTTADGGFYSFAGLADGVDTVTPSKSGYSCEPPSNTLTLQGADLSFPTFVCVERTSSHRGVWGTGPDDVWVASGAGTVLHWNGTGWTRLSTGTTKDLLRIWGSGRDDVWAVGPGGFPHWSGTAWSSEESDLYASSIWGSGPDDVWAFGGGGYGWHWDGTLWSFVEGLLSTPLSAYIEGIWGSGPGDVWAVGSFTVYDVDDDAVVVPLRMHWNGTTWSFAEGDVYASSIWGSGRDDVWAVGPGGISHWNGSKWSTVSDAMDMGASSHSVWGSGPNDVWAVGYFGIVLHWNGSAWLRVPNGTAGTLYSVWGSGPSDVWAVGEGATILHWDGNTWSGVMSPP